MAHEFACFTAQLPLHPSIGSIFELVDESIIHRLIHVLRLQQDQTIILFNAYISARCTVRTIHKRAIQFVIESIEPIARIEPELTLCIAVLKKESLSEAVYNAAELGVTTIRLVNTQHIQRSFMGATELRKLQLTAIAAAEQSKNFAIPTIVPPVNLAQVIQELVGTTTTKIVCDVNGTSIIKYLAGLQENQTRHITVMVGPEADFSMQERNTLQASGFVSCRLTPTILRSTQAVSVCCGVIRSL